MTTLENLQALLCDPEGNPRAGSEGDNKAIRKALSEVAELQAEVESLTAQLNRACVAHVEAKNELATVKSWQANVMADVGEAPFRGDLRSSAHGSYFDFVRAAYADYYKLSALNLAAKLKEAQKEIAFKQRRINALVLGVAPTPLSGEPGPVIDLKNAMYDQLAKAASESNWIPSEYMANDWINDCCDFLRNGRSVPGQLGDAQAIDFGPIFGDTPLPGKHCVGMVKTGEGISVCTNNHHIRECPLHEPPHLCIELSATSMCAHQNGEKQ